MRLLLQNGRQDAEKASSRDRRPRATRENSRAWRYRIKPRDTPYCRMLFRIPAFPAHSVSQSRRGQTWHSVLESLPILHPEILSAVHPDARFMRRCVDTRRIKCKKARAIGPRKCRPLTAKLIRARASSKIYMDLPSISRKRVKVRAVFVEAHVEVK